MARVDILLPVKNGIAFLAESIDSVVEQTDPDWRLLVLDHGSSDGSLALARRYAEHDARIEVHCLPDARGLAGLLNEGIDRADCEFLMRHDADDICMPDRIERSLAAHRRFPRCVVVGGQVTTIDARGQDTGRSALPTAPDRVGAASFFRNPIVHPATMFKYDAVRRRRIRYGVDFLGVLPEAECIRVPELAEDYLLFGQLAIFGECMNVPETLLRYRWHGANVSAQRKTEQMKVTVAVARFLAASFCEARGMPHFDPAPFSNFGDSLMTLDAEIDLDAAFLSMAAAVRDGLGRGAGVERELAFRRVVATRNDWTLAGRYLSFALRHRRDPSEWNAVRSWLARRVTGREFMPVEALPVHP